MSKDNGVKGFWCEICHYGSMTTKAFEKCPQCGSSAHTTKAPFPQKPMTIGSTNPNGKTAGKGKRPNKGNPQAKILAKLEARKKAAAAHGNRKGKQTQTPPGSMKKGGGW